MYHEERRDNEIWVGNTRTENDLSYLQGKVKFRKGEQAYYLDGKKISTDYMRPLFIEKDDFIAYNNIMDARGK
ncbi:MAG TPA: hypothetical protein VLH56_08790 [Dissulfurispiraceae bacterium]|nr:hypothetical protein [Dissulfurispiraceae bacterium]